MPLILTLRSEKYMHLNVMEHRQVYHLKDTTKQQNVFMVFSKRRLNSLDVFRHSVEKPHNTCIRQLVSTIIFESSYFIGSSEENSFGPPFCVWYSANLFLWIVATFILTNLIVPCLYIDRVKKNPDINHMER